MGAWVLDPAEDKLILSPEASSMLDLGTESLKTSLSTLLEQRGHAGDRDRLKRELAVALEKGLSYSTEFRLVDRDGAIRWIE